MPIEETGLKRSADISDAVSVVPAEVRMETFVRGGSREAILDANMKVDRCLRAGTMAIGAEVEINTIPGYLP
jgi:metal-dependent amidase/aminoacylase/carboxypeptidase family protein